LDGEGASRRQPPCRTSTIVHDNIIKVEPSPVRLDLSAYSERFVELLWNIEPDDFNGDFPTLERAPEYPSRVHIFCRLQGIDTVDFEFQRIGDQLVVAAKFAKFV
jgi:hypothetical protein